MNEVSFLKFVSLSSIINKKYLFLEQVGGMKLILYRVSPVAVFFLSLKKLSPKEDRI